MAKSSNGSTTKGPTDETKARRAPARRTASRKPTDAAASAPDLARTEPAAQRQQVAASGAKERASRNTPNAPSPEEVRRRAYELYVRRGGTDGSDKDDWYEAERQLRSRTH
jgi:hypothetical protein